MAELMKTISAIFTVKSSSLLPLVPIVTEGRIQAGGTRNWRNSISSGRERRETSRFSKRQSSSGMRRKSACTTSGVKSCVIFPTCSLSNLLAANASPYSAAMISARASRESFVRASCTSRKRPVSFLTGPLKLLQQGHFFVFLHRARICWEKEKKK